MFAWFQKLLPYRGGFFELFEEHAAQLVAAADAMADLANSGASNRQAIQAIHDHEHEADRIIREVLTSVRRTFLTPFDRGAITSLIGAMDDAIDEMQAAARAIEVYQVDHFEPEMIDMTSMIVRVAALTNQAVPLLRDVVTNGAQIHKLTEQIVDLEGEADDVHAEGLKRAFATHSKGSPIQFIVSREIYKHLERITDAFEDVANEIDGIVIDHA
jgi:hypothetical protein